MLLDADTCYRALLTRDSRFDGRFFTGVRTTGIFCRPVCPAKTPKQANCTFYETAEAALEAGFRPCLRCRPERAPQLSGTSRLSPQVARALELIGEGGLEEQTLGELASQIGTTERHMRRLFVKELGASPLTVVQTRRVLFAKQLLDETRLPIIQVAMAAGFKSLRRFNEVIRRTYERTPGELRRAGKGHGDNGHIVPHGSTLTLRIPVAGPYNWPALLSFLQGRAIPGVEHVAGNTYHRSIAIGNTRGTVAVRPSATGDALEATITITDIAPLAQIVDRLRTLFDTGAQSAVIDAHLSQDEQLRPLVAARAGMRVPGAWDRFELAVRAILGQQVSVRGATTLAGRLVERFGEPLLADGNTSPVEEAHMLFPSPESLAGQDLRNIGLPGARARAIADFAAAVVADRSILRDVSNLEDCAVRRLCGFAGIGQWTAHYIAMRALRQTDAFPVDDLVLKRAIEQRYGVSSRGEIAKITEAWRPWRAYAAMYLWAGASDSTNGNTQ